MTVPLSNLDKIRTMPKIRKIKLPLDGIREVTAFAVLAPQFALAMCPSDDPRPQEVLEEAKDSVAGGTKNKCTASQCY
jgi:hypothetical protein